MARADVDEVEHLGQSGPDLRRPQSVEPALEGEQLPPALAIIERRRLQGGADTEPHLLGFIDDVVAGHHGPSLARSEQGAQHPQECRFSRPVGTEEPVDLARGHGEIDPVDGGHRPEAPDQARGHNGRLCWAETRRRPTIQAVFILFDIRHTVEYLLYLRVRQPLMTFEPLTPERRRQQTREYLLQAAARVFAERGFHGASLDEVAAAAGFTKGAVYSNFKNKEDLFLALLEANQQREMDALYATLNASDVLPEARLPDFVNLIREEIRDLGANWDILNQDSPSTP